MSFIRTASILAALKAALESIAHPADASVKLFERVDFHENKKLREALADLVVVKQRVAIIVPGGDSYTNTRQGRTILSERTSTFDLLIADRAWTKGGHEAVFGGPNNVGVLTMKDIVAEFLAARPQLGIAGVTLTPQEGAQIEIADSDVKDAPGRECFVMNYATPAGSTVITPTVPYPVA